MGLLTHDSLSTSASTTAVRCIFSAEIASPLFALQEEATRQAADLRLVTIELDELPPLDRLLNRLVQGLAEAAFRLWPDWHDKADLGAIHSEWLNAAKAACGAGRIPLLPRLSMTLQAEQLSLALAERRLVAALIVKEAAAAPERLLALARGAEWLAREANAQTLLVLPAELMGRTELDSVNFGAIYIEAPKPSQTIADAEREEKKHLVCPIVGRPHPESPGEQRLAKWLERQPDLANLFGFNEWVTSVFGASFLADLLWEEGRLVVEIDGHRYHATRSAFNADRDRDYELQVSGYLVLRLPHDLVMDELEAAGERIRQMVAFRKKHPFVKREAPV